MNDAITVQNMSGNGTDIYQRTKVLKRGVTSNLLRGHGEPSSEWSCNLAQIFAVSFSLLVEGKRGGLQVKKNPKVRCDSKKG